MHKLDLQDTLDRLGKHPLVETHKGASVADIKHALGLLRVRLPKNYQLFLREVGWADLNGDVIFGLGPDAKKAQDLEERNIDAHVNLMVRSTCVVIHEDGMGGFNCLDVTRIKGNDCPVVYWDTNREDAEFHKPPLVAKSFVNYLRRLLKEAPTVET